MTRVTFFILFALLVSKQPAGAQVTVDSVYSYKKLNRSLSFAQLTYGGEVLCTTGGQSTLNGVQRHLGPSFQPRLTIGGLHFWGHADFYVTFPLLAFTKQPDFASKFGNTEGVETGLKIYPWALRPGKLRPYAGISFQPYTLKYRADGQNDQSAPAKFDRFISPVQTGLTFTTSKWLFTAGARYNWHRDFNYYETKTQTASIRLRPLNFHISVLRYIDTDKGMGTPKGVRQQNIMYHILKTNDKLDSWYWGIGPSAALQMSKSPYFKSQYPFLAGQSLNSFLIPDLSFGRYFSKPDLNVGLSARTMFFKTAAFDTKIRLQRHTVGLEAYKFLFDYHGFVPFVGPVLGMDYLGMEENGIKTADAFKPSLGIIFGWDIRVTKTGTSLLRTNLRYAPGLHLNASDGTKVMFNQLEFNFIQFVTFIGRKKLYRQYSQ